MSTDPICRGCGAPLRETFVDLGLTPLANSMVRPDDASAMEPFYPLHAFVCSACKLVQLAEFESPRAIFSDYVYFSSYSESWLRHSARFADAAIARFGLGANSLVVEIASNDGYLLQYFARQGVPVLGIDPAANVAREAIAKGIPTEIAFFDAEMARRLRASGRAADLMVANNVLAHVPDLHGFLEGFRILLAPGGVATFEFPHLLRLVERIEFDTIYHEHFSYFSLLAVQALFARHELRIFDVDEITTHGGSLRLYACHADNSTLAVAPNVERVLAAERGAGLDRNEPYRAFGMRAVEVKCGLLEFLIGARRRGEVVIGYGAPAKGNTLLNYCGIGPDLLAFTVDRSPHKQGLLLPGSRIPVREPAALLAARPDYVLILPWNLREEIAGQMQAVRAWGGHFVVPIPAIEVF